MATAIEFENVGKQYRLGLVSTRTLSHDLERWWKMNILRQEDPYLTIGETNDRATKGSSDYVWALRDINFKVEQGDVVGIIGRNGAGKSTLLKLLSKVTGPTTGCIRARGRIGSLLEVGTGFHPEMTGRENIYMNGAILGMTKSEITRKLDEIVDFSGCERYLDTPVKRYSSGMMVRLGFAVAAHLDPEILVVDEVLAVGDAEFQKKAIGKMKDVSRGEGRTVLFVSHNMNAVKSLCKIGVLLSNGMLSEISDVDTVVSHYLCGDDNVENHKLWTVPEIKSNSFEVLEIGCKRKDASYNEPMRMDQDIELIIRYKVKRDFEMLHITYHFKNGQGQKLFSTSCADSFPLQHKVGEYELVCHIPANTLNWGTFGVDLYVVENGTSVILQENDVVTFAVSNKAVEYSCLGREPGDMTPKFEYSEMKLN